MNKQLHELRKGQKAALNRLKATLRDHSPKEGHPFNHHIATQAETDRTRSIAKAAI